VISIVACCHSVKLCLVQPSQKERAIDAVRCKKEGMLLQPLLWRCVECVIHHERDMPEEQHQYVCGRNKQ